MARIALIPLPVQWGDQTYNDNLALLHHSLEPEKLKRLYIHLTSAEGLANHTLEELEKILINTYYLFMDNFFDVDVIVIPPLQNCDPQSYLPDIQFILSSCMYDWFVRVVWLQTLTARSYYKS